MLCWWSRKALSPRFGAHANKAKQALREVAVKSRGMISSFWIATQNTPCQGQHSREMAEKGKVVERQQKGSPRLPL